MAQSRSRATCLSLSIELYEQVLVAVATMSADRRFHTIIHLVLSHALKQFSRYTPVGLKIRVIQCLPPVSTMRVICLYEREAFGTSPWRHEPCLEFHGAESLAGRAAMTRSPVVSQDIQTNPEFLPIRMEEHAKSVAVYPLLQGGCVAGCLQVSCTELNYFSLPCLDILHSYAYLLALAFPTQAFYEHQHICLHLMPDAACQQSHLASFRQRVVAQMKEMQYQGQTHLLQAELRIIQEMAQEMADL